MKISAIACAGLLLCLLPAQVSATTLNEPTLSDALTHINVVCVGTVGAIHTVGTDSFDTGQYTASKTKPNTWVHWFAKATVAVADVAVDDTVKGGPLPAHIPVEFAQDPQGYLQGDMQYGFPATMFLPTLTPGQRVVMFLKHDIRTGRYRVCSLFQSGQIGVIALGKAPPLRPGTAATPLRHLLLLLVQSLSYGPDKDARNGTLRWIGRVGDLLYLNFFTGDAIGSGYLHRFKQQRQALREGPGLETFVAKYVCPAVRMLASDPNKYVRGAADMAGSQLQDIHILPAIARNTDTGFRESDGPAYEQYANDLTVYRIPAAVRPLAALLKNAKPEVRRGAAEGLRQLANPLAIPALLDRLTREKDDAALTYAFFALHDCAHAGADPDMPVLPAQKASLRAFWTHWAAAHRARVKSLRVRFAAYSMT